MLTLNNNNTYLCHDKDKTTKYQSTNSDLINRLNGEIYDLEKIKVQGNKIVLNYFNKEDPYIRLGAMFYYSFEKAFNDYCNEVEELSKKIINNIIIINKYKTNSAKIVKEVKKAIESFKIFFEFCFSHEFIHNTNDRRYFNIVNDAREEILDSFDEYTKPENIVISNISYQSKIQQEWNTRILELNKIRSKTETNYIQQSSSLNPVCLIGNLERITNVLSNTSINNQKLITQCNKKTWCIAIKQQFSKCYDWFCNNEKDKNSDLCESDCNSDDDTIVSDDDTIASDDYVNVE